MLGTEFNIKAYSDDESVIYTTLVEGKVVVKSSNNEELLYPSQQSSLNILDDKITVNTVDVRSQISWKEGVYIFKSKPLKEIMKTLSRWYDMDVIYEDKKLEEVLFNGALNKNDNILDMLNDIKNFGIIKNYEIKNKTLTLK